MKYKDFKWVIITDGQGSPMAFGAKDGQLCYCDDEFWEDDVHPIMVVSKKTAERHIKLTKQYRKKNHLSQGLEFKCMPVIFSKKLHKEVS